MLTGVPPYNNNYKLDPQDDLVLFHDDDGHDVAGTAYRIHVWNKDLTDDVVLSTCNCILPASDKPCKANLIHIPAYSKIDYSSTYGNYQVISRAVFVVDVLPATVVLEENRPPLDPDLHIKITAVYFLFFRKAPTMGKGSLTHRGGGVQDLFKKENICRLIQAMFRLSWVSLLKVHAYTTGLHPSVSRFLMIRTAGKMLSVDVFLMATQIRIQN